MVHPARKMAHPGRGRVGVWLAEQGLPRCSGGGSRYPGLCPSAVGGEGRLQLRLGAAEGQHPRPTFAEFDARLLDRPGIRAALVQQGDQSAFVRARIRRPFQAVRIGRGVANLIGGLTPDDTQHAFLGHLLPHSSAVARAPLRDGCPGGSRWSLVQAGRSHVMQKGYKKKMEK
jgi:hypothetical protein